MEQNTYNCNADEEWPGKRRRGRRSCDGAPYPGLPSIGRPAARGPVEEELTW